MTFLTCSLYALFLAFLLGAGVLSFMLVDRARIRIVRALAITGLVAVTVLPIVIVQRRALSDMRRSANSIRRTSAQPVDYVQLHKAAWGDDIAFWLRTRKGGSRHYLYPGTAVLLLAILGCVAGRRGRYRVWVCSAIAVSAVAVMHSFGLNLQLGDWQPYDSVRDHVPGFAHARNTFRFAVFVQIFLVILAGVGLHLLWIRTARVGHITITLVVCTMTAEVFAMPQRLHNTPDPHFRPIWVEVLTLKPSGPVVMFPLPESGKAREYEVTATNMLHGLHHGMPTVNGYSGFFPSSYQQLASQIRDFPARGGIQRLVEHGVEYIVADSAWLDSVIQPGESRSELAPFVLIHRDGKVTIYAKTADRASRPS